MAGQPGAGFVTGAPTLPGLSFAFRIEAEIAPPRSAGPGLSGQRLHIPITGGIVSGPRLSGRILPGGSDWALIRPDGMTRIEAHYTIEAEDGTLIYVVNTGLRISTPEALAKVRQGEALPPEAFYMRGAPVFDAPHGPHGWMNDRLFVCAIRPRSMGVDIGVYVLE